MEKTSKDTLVDRYLASVSDLLPAKLRQDNVTEIRSLIQDALDDRSKVEGRQPDDKMMAEVLKEFGAPEKIVAPYLPEKYLIGPRLYPIFTLVLRIVLPIVAVLVLVAYWLGAMHLPSLAGSEFIIEVVKSLGGAFSATVQAFANIVIIFAILQWVIPEFKVSPREREWDPHSLKVINKPDQIKRGELITEIVFISLALVIFNFYFDRIGIYNNINGQWSFTPILTNAFKVYIPWFNLLWITTILLNFLILRKGVWQMGTRLLSILVSALNIAIAISLMGNISLVYTLEGATGSLGGIGMLKSLINQFLLIALGISIIANGAKIIRMILAIVKNWFQRS